VKQQMAAMLPRKRSPAEVFDDDDDAVLAHAAAPADSSGDDESASDADAPPTKKARSGGPRKPERPAEPQVPAAKPPVSLCADGSPSLPLSGEEGEDGSPSDRVRFLYALLHWVEAQKRPDGEPLYQPDTQKNVAASIPRILDALEGDLGRLPNFPMLGSDRDANGKLLPIKARPVGERCRHVRALWKALPASKQPAIYGTWDDAVAAGIKDVKPDDSSEYWVMNNEVLRSGFCGFDAHDKLAQAVKIMYQFCYRYLVTLSYERKGWADLTRYDPFAKMLMMKTAVCEAVPEKKKAKPAAVA
jgi:hypothetical protein